MKATTTTPKNVYQMVTDRIIAQMEQGIIPWRKPWHGILGKRESHKTEGPLLPISGNGENTRWDYSDCDTAHNYGIEQATILSTFKTEGQR